ncbi:SUKH-3 domain-containing protein [Dactylosporangium sp. NPDC051541]|uniref:SUKH-3 domain-containing protein n=1 Tax=Dactylosporangium sp. NPDC051541 TaxID=3363977 RepID=UPI0037887BA6
MTEAARFPAGVETALREAGWAPGRDETPRARMWGLALASHASPSGHQHTVGPAALAAFAEFGGLTVRAGGDGAEVAGVGIVFDPLRGLHAASTLAELGELVRARLTPLGEQDDGAGLLAVDDQGRVFVVDHTADWYAGASVDEAIATLLGGRRPARVLDDGTWA